MKQFLTVLKYEYMGYWRNKVYVIMTIVVVLGIAITLSFPRLLNLFQAEGVTPGEEPQKQTIALVDRTETGGYADFLKEAIPDYDWRIQDSLDENRIRADINDDVLYGALVIDSPLQYSFYVKRLGFDANTPQFDQALKIKYEIDALNVQGVEPSISGEIIGAVPEGNMIETGKSTMNTFFYTYILLFLLYFSIMMYGQMVATAVATEKSSRAMEMLITSAKPLNLMFGKVLGAGLAGLSQIGILLCSAFLFYNLNASMWGNDIIRSLFNMTPEIILFTALFYVLGFFMYAFLYGALGSLANRLEDINVTIMPIILLFVAAFMISVTGMMGDPDSPLMLISSFIPFFAPMVMFVRICMTDVPSWQIVISVVLTIGSIGFVGWLSAKIYRIGVLMYGKPPKLNELFRMLKNAKN